MTRRLLLFFLFLTSLLGTGWAVDVALRKQAKSEDSGERRKAAKALAAEGSPQAVKLLTTLLRDERPYVRDWSVRYCENLKDAAAIQALLPLLKRRDALERRNGVAALGRTKSAIAGEALHRVLARERNPDVLGEALYWLRHFPDQEDTAKLLAALSEHKEEHVRGMALIALVQRRHADAPRIATERLADTDEGVRCTAQWALAIVARAEASKHLGKFHPKDSWRARAQAVDSALALGDTRSMDVLIELLAADSPRVHVKAHEALRRLSGKQFGPEPDLWKAWFEPNRATWSAPKQLHSLTASAKDGRTTVKYHGIDIASAGIVFAIDQSGSMSNEMTGKYSGWTRWGLATSHLNRALAALPDGLRVNVLLFNDEVTPVFKKTKKLNDDVRKDVKAFLARSVTGGETNIYDTLHSALVLDGVDTLFLLGDGAPTRGSFKLTSRVVPYVWGINRRRKLIVNTIAVGADDSGRELLREIAAKCHGRAVKY